MTKPAILYHYCSNSAFHSIMSQRRVRLSLLSMSNDTKEGQHILDLAGRILPDGFPHRNDALEQLKQVISGLSAIGFCLSADGDVLSQWRGYADNAQGVALGFDFAALKAATEQERDDHIIVRIGSVFYDGKPLEAAMKPYLQPVIAHYESGAMKQPQLSRLLMATGEETEEEKKRIGQAFSKLFYMLFDIANYAYMIKAPFFIEEQEWRIMAHLTNLMGVLALPSAQFQPSAEKLKPFRDFPLKGFVPSMIKEVVLGPRNQTPSEVMRLFLDSLGFDHVTFRNSTGSYR